MKKRILVVDDDPYNREMLGLILKVEGYQVEIAPNGEMALSMMEQKFRPDLILLDLFMPQMDGMDFVHELMTRELREAIPILFISSSADVEELIKQDHLVALVKKPFDPLDLLNLVVKYTTPQVS